MKWAALITWVLTAGGGFILLTIWLRRGGLKQRGHGGSRIRTPLIFSHFGLAAAGLVVWLVYLANDSTTLAWIAFAALAVVAVLGWTMFGIWWKRRSLSRGQVDPEGPPEQHFLVSVVTLHGLLAVTTVVLVLLTALGVGGS